MIHSNDLIHGSFWITRSTVVLRQNQGKARIEEEPEEGALASELEPRTMLVKGEIGPQTILVGKESEPASNSFHHS